MWDSYHAHNFDTDHLFVHNHQHILYNKNCYNYIENSY